MIDYFHGVTLRRLDPDNTDEIATTYDWRNDIKIKQWCRQREPLHPTGHKAWFHSQAVDPKVSMYAIDAYDLEDMVGVCGLTDIDHINSRAEFSCYIGPEYWRRGYAKSALKTLFTHGFKELNLHCIWGECFEANPAINLFLGLGMLLEGTRRSYYYKNNRYIDAHLVSLTREDFEREKSRWEQESNDRFERIG